MMTQDVLFQMWGGFRASLIRAHNFYVEQARMRLLSQFANMEAEADQASKEWLEEMSGRFDPEIHDEGDVYEGARDAGIEFYQLLSDMQTQTRLSVLAGMYHEWEKQLRDWLASEVQHWHRGAKVSSTIWSADFSQLANLFAGFGWEVRGNSYFNTLDACRLVVNVYKHGAGRSLDELAEKYPQYLPSLWPIEAGSLLADLPPDHTRLNVTDEQFQEFSDAIVAFWRDVPENITDSQVGEIPKWFENAIEADRNRKAAERAS